jgi:K+-transporting ATPase ATPase A chain
MTINGWIQILIYCVLVTALVVPLGWYMTRVFNGERTFLSLILRPVEVALYRLGGVDEKREQDWLTYTVAMLLFNAAGFFLLYALLRLQDLLPLNPAGMSAVAPDLAFNTAVSFATNTNWQNYGGESTRPISCRSSFDAQELCRGDWHRARGCADPRLCARR